MKSYKTWIVGSYYFGEVVAQTPDSVSHKCPMTERVIQTPRSELATLGYKVVQGGTAIDIMVDGFEDNPGPLSAIRLLAWNETLGGLPLDKGLLTRARKCVAEPDGTLPWSYGWLDHFHPGLLHIPSKVEDPHDVLQLYWEMGKLSLCSREFDEKLVALIPQIDPNSVTRVLADCFLGLDLSRIESTKTITALRQWRKGGDS